MNVKIKEKHLRWIFFSSVVFFTFIIYMLTTAPTIVFWDVGEFLATSYILGIPHPPGTPLYVILGRFFALLPLPLNTIKKITLISILSGAFSAGFVYLITVKVIDFFKGENISKWIQHLSGLLGGFIAPFAYTTWWSSIEAETYAPSNFFMFLATYLALIWWEKRQRKDSVKYLILIIYLLALGSGIHLSAPFIFPAILIFVLVVKPRMVLDWESLGVFSIFFIVISGIFGSFTPPSWGKALGFYFIGTAGTGLFLYLKKHFKGLGLKEGIFFVSVIITFAGLYLKSPVAFIIGVLLTAITAFVSGKLYIECKGVALILVFIAVSAGLYLIIRAHHNPTINEADPKTWQAFWDVLLRKQYPPADFFPRRIPFIEQLKLFWTYFAGRQGDVAMPPQYVPLIFILGFIGFALHIAYDRKSFALVGSSLILATLGLIFVLNLKYSATDPRAYIPQEMREVRDRDYFFIPGYFYFAIYTGLGFFGVFKLAIENLKFFKKIALYVALPVAILIPVWQLSAYYKMVDRSKNYVAEDYAYNLLHCVDDGGIVFTNGDNDTFPLWCAQEVLGIKKSVTIANLSLLNTNWYNKQLKSWGVPLYFKEEDIDKLTPFIGPDNKVVLVRDLIIRDMLAANFGYQLPKDPKEYIALPRSNLRFPKIYLAPPEEFARKVIEGRQPKKPIFFSITCETRVYKGFSDYLILEGMAYRIVPYKVDKKTPLGYAVNMEKTDSLFHKVFRFRGFVDNNKFFIDRTHQRLLSNYRAPLMVLAIEYFNRGEVDKAIENIEFALNFEGNRDLMDKDDKRIVYFMKLQLAQFSIADGKYDKAISVCKELIKEEKNSVVYTLMGDAYRGEGKKELAKKYYKLALELPPAFIKTYESLIEIYMQENHTDSAKQIFKLAKKRFGTVPGLDSLKKKYKID